MSYLHLMFHTAFGSFSPKDVKYCLKWSLYASSYRAKMIRNQNISIYVFMFPKVYLDKIYTFGTF